MFLSWLLQRAQRASKPSKRTRRQTRLSRLTQQLEVERLETRECPALTLTPAGQALGLSLSTFATGFPTTSGNGGTGNGIAGPTGIAFPTSGGVVVGDAQGNVRLFPSDTDGQTASSAPVGQNYGLDNALGVAPVGTHIYMNELLNGQVVEINLDGTLNQVIVTGVPLAAGMVANPTNGHLFVSTIGNNQVWEVDPIAKTKSLFVNASFDGLAISADGTVLYGARVYNDPATQGHVWGYDTSTKALVFDSGFLGTVGIDGIALGTGPLAGNLFVNTNDGTVIEVNVTTLTQTTIATNGTRGDFVTVDPINNTLLLTQSDSIVRLSPGNFQANKTNTTTVVASNNNPSVYGQSVTFTATVNSVVSGVGTPSGTVTFKDGSTSLGTGTLQLVGGQDQATFSTSALAAGSHTIYAVYSGDTNFNTSTGSTSQTVNQAPLTVTADNKVKVYGQANPVFTASYSGFVNGDTPASLGGTLSLTTTATTASAAGTYPIVASGLTSSNYALTFVNGTLTVNPDGTTTTLTSNASPAIFSQAVTFSATVSANAPGSGMPLGTITFYDGSVALGTASLNGGTASFTTTALSGGISHTITAVYNDTVDSNFLTSSSSLTQTVEPGPGRAVAPGQTATIGFWHNNGQALITNFNGGATATALANWLANTFPHLYGVNAGANNLAGKTNAQVATFYQRLYNLGGKRVDAEVLTTALNVYATTSFLGGTAGAQYGFTVTAGGVGAKTWNVGSNGAAFAVANNTVLTVIQLLQAADKQAVNGVLYNGNSTLRDQADVVFDGINQSGDIL
jgi:hypothetical protein